MLSKGPDRRFGARGDGTALYIRDPDHNLVELCYYDEPDSSGGAKGRRAQSAPLPVTSTFGANRGRPSHFRGQTKTELSEVTTRARGTIQTGSAVTAPSEGGPE